MSTLLALTPLVTELGHPSAMFTPSHSERSGAIPNRLYRGHKIKERPVTEPGLTSVVYALARAEGANLNTFPQDFEVTDGLIQAFIDLTRELLQLVTEVFLPIVCPYGDDRWLYYTPISSSTASSSLRS